MLSHPLAPLVFLGWHARAHGMLAARCTSGLGAGHFQRPPQARCSHLPAPLLEALPALLWASAVRGPHTPYGGWGLRVPNHACRWDLH